jgi:hypothetical protein
MLILMQLDIPESNHTRSNPQVWCKACTILGQTDEQVCALNKSCHEFLAEHDASAIYHGIRRYTKIPKSTPAIWFGRRVLDCKQSCKKLAIVLEYEV